MVINQTSKDNVWIDEAKMQIPYNRTTQLERIKEKMAYKILLKSQDVNFKLLELKELMDAALGKSTSMINSKLQGMQNSLDKLGNSGGGVLSNLTKKVEAFGLSNTKSLGGISSMLPNLSSGISSLINPYTLVAAAGVAAVGVITKSVSAAMDWETGMAKANVTMQLTKEQLKGVSSEVLNIAKQSFVKDINQVPEAFNRLVSSGMDTNTALKALKPTLDAAKAGFADVDTVAMAAASTMNAAGVKDATKVYDVLFATLNKGNAEFSDIANYLPKLIPAANALGISLETTSGAFAYLTAQGFKAEAAATGLQNVFKAFGDKETIKGFNNIGINIFDTQGKMRPLIKIVDDLKAKMAGLSDQGRVAKFGSIGLDQESATALGAMLTNTQSLKDTIDFTTNSAGQLDAALNNSLTTSDRFAQIGNSISAKFIEIGEAILPYVNAALDALMPVGQAIWSVISGIGNAIWGIVTTAVEWLQPVFSGIQSIFSAIWNIVSGIFGFIWKIVEPIELIIKKLGIFQFLGNAIKTAFEAVGWVFNKIGDAISWVYDNIIKPVIDAISWAIDGFKELIGVAEDAKVAGDALKPEDGKKDVNAFDPTAMPPTVAPVIPANLMGATNSPKQAIEKAPKISNKGVTSVTGNAQQQKNIVVNIKNVVEKFVTENKEIAKMNKEEVKAFFTDLIVRTTRGIDSSYN
jgi:TP901 family phage tail tape measure protein